MIISIISAMDKNRIIGKDNRLPWALPADLNYFKKQTEGKPIIMGSKTYESIGRPLPNRKNIVMSFDKSYSAPGCTVVTSIKEALKEAQPAEEVMVSGGASVYKQFLPLANRLYLTFINNSFEGDARFPKFDILEWEEISREDHEPDNKNKYAYSFVIYQRR